MGQESRKTLAKKRSCREVTFFFLNESTLDFLHNPSTLSPFQLADSSDPSWFCSHAISSRSFLGLHRLHTPSATSHILSQASVRHFLPCIRYVWYVLPGLLLLGVPLKLGPSLIHPSAPPPSPTPCSAFSRCPGRVCCSQLYICYATSPAFRAPSLSF